MGIVLVITSFFLCCGIIRILLSPPPSVKESLLQAFFLDLVLELIVNIANKIETVMNKIIINGEEHSVEGRNIAVTTVDNKTTITVNNKVVQTVNNNNVVIRFEGDLATLDCHNVEVHGNIIGDVDAHNIKCNDIFGEVDAHNVSCRKVRGKVIM
jgi:hypothetical protein